MVLLNAIENRWKLALGNITSDTFSSASQNTPVLVTDFSITLPAVAETTISKEATVPGVPESGIVVVVFPAATFA
jgi:hypothetical protein